MFWFFELLRDHYLIVLGVFLATGYTYLKYLYSYFDRAGVEYVKPTFFFGNSLDMAIGRETVAQSIKKNYNAIKGRFGGTFMFTRPQWLIKDPELVHQILIKDFDNFVNHGFYLNEKDDPLSAHLLSLVGDKWKTMRSRLSPTFTSGKLKYYSTIIEQLAERMQKHIEVVGKQHNHLFEARDLMGRFTTNIITSIAFGVEIDSINNPKEPFYKVGQLILDPKGMSVFKLFFSFACPNVMKFLKIKVFDQRIEDFLRTVTEQSLKLREKDKLVRHDFMQLLVLLRNGAKVTDDGKWQVTELPEKDKILNINEVMAQVFIFFLGGFETTASSTSMVLFEIARHPEVQQKLQNEIDEVLKQHDGKLNFESVHDMKYLGQCFDEALRMYPSVLMVFRVAERDYKIPKTDKIIRKGDAIGIPVFGLHNDPKYFPNPNVYDPERFSPQNKPNLTPYSYIPFSDGPRNCIGMRLALLQAKLGLSAIFAKFNIGLAPGQTENIKFDPRGVFNVVGGINLTIKPR